MDSSHAPDSYETWQASVETMFRMMWNQAGGRPTGNHGLFHKYRIESVTLQGVKLKSSKRVFNMLQMQRWVCKIGIDLTCWL